jgi:hypothetical protein
VGRGERERVGFSCQERMERLSRLPTGMCMLGLSRDVRCEGIDEVKGKARCRVDVGRGKEGLS